MKTEKLNSWLTLLANIGVVIGLVLLIIEIRQNTEVARSTAELEVSNLQTEFFMRLAGNPDLSRIVLIGNQDSDALNAIEKTQYVNHYVAVFMTMEGTYKQYQRGFIPEDGWTPYEGLIQSIMANPLVEDWWINGSTVFSPKFEAIVSEVSGVSRKGDP